MYDQMSCGVWGLVRVKSCILLRFVEEHANSRGYNHNNFILTSYLVAITETVGGY